MTASQPLPLAELSPAEQAEIERFGIYETEEKVELREQILNFFRTRYQLSMPNEVTGALLSGPLAPLLAKLRRVEAIAQRMRQDGIDSYAGDGEDDEIVRARAVALYYAADELLAAIAAPQTGEDGQ